MEYQTKRRIIGGISLFVLLLFYLFKNFSEEVRVFGFIFGLVIFYLIDHLFNIEFKLRHYYYMMGILVVGILFSSLYFTYPFYDKVLHFIFPILGCILFFYIIDKKNLTLEWKLFITFIFIIAFLAFHEIGEYLLDRLFDWNLQGVQIMSIKEFGKLNPVMSRIDDTMIDMILGVLGSSVFVTWKTVVHFWKKRRKNRGKK